MTTDNAQPTAAAPDLHTAQQEHLRSLVLEALDQGQPCFFAWMSAERRTLGWIISQMPDQVVLGLCEDLAARLKGRCGDTEQSVDDRLAQRMESLLTNVIQPFLASGCPHCRVPPSTLTQCME